MKARHDDIEFIIMELWEYCMGLEDDYHKTGDSEVLMKFAVAIMTVQYWEDVLLGMEGIDVFKVYF
jgi:hypothetical protein